MDSKLPSDPYEVVLWWREKFEKPRFVYFIQDGDDGPVKIGEAFDPKGRLAELQCGNARLLHLRAVVFASDKTERRLHRAWAEARVRGEWFEDERLLRVARRAAREQMQAIEHWPAHHVSDMASSLCRPSEAGWTTAV